MLPEITGETEMNVQRVIEAESGYQGITPDERNAIRHIFDKEEDIPMVPEQFSDILLLNGPTK
jgi:hypothetical protein